ncbi:MAG TPA: hypothetical protein VM677_15725 [Actinokineospora sp.]|nr:hypothetical protein [Actinokineospora sp.]
MDKAGAATRRFAIVAVACMAIVTAGCTASDDQGQGAVAPSSPADTPGAGGFPSGVVPATDLPADVPNIAELRNRVTMSDCVKTPSGWSAGGEINNPGASAERLQITVFFTDEHATVLDSAQTTVNVPENGKTSWTASKEFGTLPKMLCVLRGVGRA